MIQAAERLIRLGFPVHWVHGSIFGNEDSGKSPVGAGWQQIANRSLDNLRGYYKPTYNLGIRCGYIKNSPISVIAIDLDGFASLEWAATKYPPTPIKTESRPGRQHWFYLHPGKEYQIRNVKIPGRENDHFRGHFGHVVCAPSQHWSGTYYREVDEWTPQRIADMPIFDPAWAPIPVATIAPPPVDPRGASQKWGRAALDQIETEILAAREGSRNDTLNGSAYRVGRLVAGGHCEARIGLDMLHRAAERIGLGNGEIRKTIRSGFDAGMRQPHPGPERKPAPMSRDALLGAAALQHGVSAVQVMRQQGIQPDSIQDPLAREVVELLNDLPNLTPQEILQELPQLPDEWEKTPVALKEIKELPPELPQEHFAEDYTIPRYAVHVDTSQWGLDPHPPTPAAPSAHLRSNSHVAMAEEIISRISARCGGVEPVYAEGKLWGYTPDTGIWTEFRSIEAIAQSLDGLPYGHRIVRGISHPQGTINLRRSDIDGAIKSVHRITLQDDFFTLAMSGIAFRNGFIRVTPQGVVMIRNSHTTRSRFAYDFPYNPEWRCERFGRVLGELFAPNQDAVQRKAMIMEFIGASLAGVVTQYQKALVFGGPPGTGKSTVFEILKSIFPPNSVTAVLPEELQYQWEKARLAGVKLNACDDINGFTITAAGTFKAAISGNIIQGRQVGEQGFDFRPRAGHLLSFNRAPRFNDISGGIEDRIVYIKYTRRFRDTNRDHRGLWQEIVAAETPEIVAAAIEGAVRLMAQGRYTLVPSSPESLAEWSEANNPALLFSRECLQATNDLRHKFDTVYDRYRKWAEKNGHKLLLTSHALRSSLSLWGFQIHQGWITADLK